MRVRTLLIRSIVNRGARLATPLGAFLSVLGSRAAWAGVGTGNEPDASLVPQSSLESIGELYGIACIAGQWVMVLGLTLGVIFIIWGGIKYITSAGDESKAEEGKKVILYALGGVVFLILAIAFVNIAADVFGAEDFQFAFNC